MMFTGREIAATFTELGVTHVIWLPDSELGAWEAGLEAAEVLTLLRVCREGEAWPLAAGLHLGGASPLVIMQITGLFESGDALRNILFDLELPIFAILGARSWLVKDSRDSARRFAMPILDAWGLDRAIVEKSEDKSELAAHYRSCRRTGRPGAVLIAEGRM
jgi:sulfopyruvate decarboxylase TPP-binding subunit